MSSEGYHEPIDLISDRTKGLHRGIVSLIEELEAVDWYTQRAEACQSEELRAVLLHHRDEEIEHAMMNLEWLRRNSVEFDEKARIYLFVEGPILGAEPRAEGRAPAPDGAGGTAAPKQAGSLGIGSLKRRT
jgi:ferritin-like protein